MVKDHNHHRKKFHHRLYFINRLKIMAEMNVDLNYLKKNVYPILESSINEVI